MRFRDVLTLLENETHLPIVPEKIAGLLRQHSEIRQIIFIGVELDTGILRGQFVRVRYSDEVTQASIPRPYAIPETKRIAKVYYALKQTPDDTRLAINKELLHIIDPDFVRTATPTEAAALINRLRLPTDLLLSTMIENADHGAIIDYLSDYRAVVAMLPQRIRNLICKRHEEKKITEDEISHLTGIPRRYIETILSDRWDKLRELWAGLYER